MHSNPYPPIDGKQPCATVDPDLFFPEDSWTTHYVAPHAAAICRRCPFLDDCLAYALTHNVTGIWGGTSHARRQQLRKQYGITAEPVHDLDASEMHQRDISPPPTQRAAEKRVERARARERSQAS